MISAMLKRVNTNIHVIMNSIIIWKTNAEVKIIRLGVFLWHGVLTLQWKTLLVLSMATNRGRTQTAKALSFLLTKMPNWWWPHQEKGLENAHHTYDVRQKKNSYIYIYTTRIKLLLDAGLLSVFQHNADNDFIIVWFCITMK